MANQQFTGLFPRVVLGALLAPAAHAQNWPARPVRMVVGFSIGGPVDITARMLAPKLSDLWGQPDRKSTRLNSSHIPLSRMPSSA